MIRIQLTPDALGGRQATARATSGWRLRDRMRMVLMAMIRPMPRRRHPKGDEPGSRYRKAA